MSDFKSCLTGIRESGLFSDDTKIEYQIWMNECQAEKPLPFENTDFDFPKTDSTEIVYVVPFDVTPRADHYWAITYAMNVAQMYFLKELGNTFQLPDHVKVRKLQTVTNLIKEEGKLLFIFADIPSQGNTFGLDMLEGLCGRGGFSSRTVLPEIDKSMARWILTLIKQIASVYDLKPSLDVTRSEIDVMQNGWQNTALSQAHFIDKNSGNLSAKNVNFMEYYDPLRSKGVDMDMFSSTETRNIVQKNKKMYIGTSVICALAWFIMLMLIGWKLKKKEPAFNEIVCGFGGLGYLFFALTTMSLPQVNSQKAGQGWFGISILMLLASAGLGLKKEWRKNAGLAMFINVILLIVSGVFAFYLKWGQVTTDTVTGPKFSTKTLHDIQAYQQTLFSTPLQGQSENFKMDAVKLLGPPTLKTARIFVWKNLVDNSFFPWSVLKEIVVDDHVLAPVKISMNWNSFHHNPQMLYQFHSGLEYRQGVLSVRETSLEKGLIVLTRFTRDQKCADLACAKEVFVK
jgi:hypothetical protein